MSSTSAATSITTSPAPDATLAPQASARAARGAPGAHQAQTMRLAVRLHQPTSGHTAALMLFIAVTRGRQPGDPARRWAANHSAA